MIFNSSSGVISGSPTDAISQTVFTITATNCGGSISTNVSITIPPDSKSINYVEYFFDTDPGFGNGTGININSSNHVDYVINSISTTGLNAGYHNLYIRARNMLGVWSLYSGKQFFIQPANPANTQLVKAEYFLDTDPGMGNGTPIAFSSADSVDFNIASISTSVLMSGYHNVFVRVQNNLGKWSLYVGKQFFIQPATPAIPQLVKAEYFLDTDPGMGNGTPIAFSSADSVDFNIASISTSVLMSGYHNVFVRVQNNLGKWSLYDGKQFFIQPANPTNIQLVKGEYFFDSDPGLGNGNSIAINDVDSVDITIASISISGLIPGYHNVFVRAQNNLGKWSLYAGKQFFVKPATVANAQIVSAEYFFDTDPGFGNGASITPSFLSADSINISRNIATTNLALGSHILILRVKNSLGQWSLALSRSFTVNACNNFVANAYATGTSCYGSGDGYINMTVSGAQIPYSYLWSNGSTNLNLFGLHTGNYHVTITASNGCVTHADAFVSQPDSIYVISSSNAPLCSGSSLQLSASNLGGASYSWTGPNGFSSTQQNPSISNVSASASGMYSLTVTNDMGCVAHINPLEVSVQSQKTLNLKLYLEGLYAGQGFMNEASDENGLPQWGAGVADKMDVELHAENPPYNTIFAKSLVDLSTRGTAHFMVDCYLNENYYITILARNHLQTWSSIPIPFNTSEIWFDFSSSVNQAYGTDGMVQMGNQVYALFAGDLDQNGYVDLDDFSLFEPDLTQGNIGYIISDLNGSGYVDLDDFAIFEPRLTEGNTAQIPGL